MKLIGIFVGAAFACLAWGANAASVTYEFKGEAVDASLGGTAYSGPIDIVATGRTGGVTTAPSPPFAPDTLVNGNITGSPPPSPLKITITLGGLGTFDVTDPAYFFNNRTFKVLGFGGLPMGDFYDFSSLGSSALESYDLVSAIGPFAVSGGGSQKVDTTGGLFVAGFPDPGVFSARLGVPEPATWAMMLVGLGALGAGARNRRRHARTINA
jgi:hypothetical protein